MSSLAAPLRRIAPISRAAGEVRLPGSKSASIRALLMAAHADGQTHLLNLLQSDDTHVMQQALRAVGFALHTEGEESWVTGSIRAPLAHADLYLGNSGLSMRTLLPALAFGDANYRFSGVDRMHQRPIGDLVGALQHVGADIGYLGVPGFPPLEVRPAVAPSRLALAVAGDASSQFLTGLLQALPIWSAAGDAAQGDSVIGVTGSLISRPYVALTIDLMRRFGVEVAGDYTALAPQFRVPCSARYTSPGRFLIEGDASSAVYFLALGVLAGAPIRVVGVDSTSVQPDARFPDLLRLMGAEVESGAGWITASSAGVASGLRLRALDIDLNHMPDAAMTVAVLCLFADGVSRLRNIGSWRVKETDRLHAMATELRKFGAHIEEGPDWLSITPPARLTGARVATYDDHRMAMSLALVACGGVTVEIENPACVEKTLPDYFERLAMLTASA